MNNNFWRSVVSVLSGTATAQAIPIFGSLFIMRQYVPAEFGIFSAWLGMSMLLGILLTGRFETALPIESDGEPRQLAFFSTLITSLLAALVAVFVLIALISIEIIPAKLQNAPAPLLITLVPTGLGFAVTQTWQSWAAAEGRYRQLSLMRIVQSAATTLFQIIAGFFFSSASSLAIAQFLGIIISVFISFYIMPIKTSYSGKILSLILRFWQKNIKFPIFSLPADIINAISFHLPIFIVANRFGSEAAGLLALTMKTLGLPTGLLGSSMLDVFKRYAATNYRERGECRLYYIQTFKLLLFISLCFCFIMVPCSEFLFSLVFGSAWRGAGTFAVWLLPLFALRFIASPLSYMVYIANKQHLDLIWQLALLGITFMTLSMHQHKDLAIQTYSFGYSFLYLIYIFMSYRLSCGIR